MGCAPRSISTRYNPAMDDAAIEHTLRVFFQTRAPEVSAAYLFGSVARGTSGRASDVDVAVLLARPPADLIHRVLRGGKLLVDRDRALRIAFEVRAQRVLRPQAGARSVSRRSRPRSVTDRELIAKKLALVETCVEQLRRLARPAAITTDVREERFVEHTLQIAIQAALDVASHIVSDERLGEPRTIRARLG